MFVNKALSVSVDTGAAAQYADKPAELYPFLIESLTEFAVFAVASDGSIMSWNSGAQLTFGYRQAEIIGKNFSLIFTADDVAAGAPAEELASAQGRLALLGHKYGSADLRYRRGLARRCEISA
jgi:PAS domain-containing protein